MKAYRKVFFLRKWIAILLFCVVSLQFIFIYNRDQLQCDPDDSDEDDNSWQKNFHNPSELEKNDFAESVTNDNESSDALIFPVPSRDKGFLTVGIPTIKRKGASYLHQTISSLLDNMSPEEKKEVLIVVFLADTDPDTRQSRADEIKSQFKEYVETGMIHIIQAPATYYPDFEFTKITLHQKLTYVKWRARQCYDYAYLMEYSRNLSTYYMQLEDDVVTTEGYIGAIKEFMNKMKRKIWVCLEFSELGFIGKLYRNRDLLKLAALIKLFYIELPVDYTYNYFNLMNDQMRQRLRKPTLFQHKGIHSSFPGKLQPLRDRFYSNNTERDEIHNPPANIYSNIPPYMTYYPFLAYNGGTDGFFWSLGPPRLGGTITIVFHEAQTLRRVVVETGNDVHPNDILRYGVLLVGFAVEKVDDIFKCLNVSVIGEFKDGRINVGGLEETVKTKAACLIVKVVRKQSGWLLVHEIKVTVVKTPAKDNSNTLS